MARRSKRPPGLSDRFLIPPFSVMDTRQGYWQERKKSWVSLGIQSELGRGDDQGGDENGVTSTKRLTYDRREPTEHVDPVSQQILKIGVQRSEPSRLFIPDGTLNGTDRDEDDDSPGSRAFHARPSHGPTVTKNADGTLNYNPTNNGEGAGTSVFDPVLCELTYRWFCPPGGLVLDPFAGGSVRGVTAGLLGYPYVGIDLSSRQVAANKVQAIQIVPEGKPIPRWFVGDSTKLSRLPGSAGSDGLADLIFTCPPYHSLEKYSNDPKDLSNMSYEGFIDAYREIIARAVALLRPDRFAAYVVGDIRGTDGCYRGLVADTINIFLQHGCRLYNQAIIVTSVGSLPIRVGKQFAKNRKLGSTHQHLLIFVKGDPLVAAEACQSELETATIPSRLVLDAEVAMRQAWDAEDRVANPPMLD